MGQGEFKVLMISTDRNIFDKDSAVAGRMKDYATIFEELHIIVFSLQNLEAESSQLTANCWAYPTNSKSKFGYIFDAVKIGKGILSNVFFGQSIISAQDPYETGLVGLWLKKVSGFPLQIQIHTDFANPNFYQESISNLVRFILSPFLLKKADGIRVVSKHIADSIQAKKYKLKARLSVLPIFVDINAIRNDPVMVNLRMKYDKWDKIALVTSRIEPEKKIETVIKAFSRVVKNFSKSGLVIVGSGSQEKKLKNMVKKLGISENVAFESWQQNITSYMKTADVFLNPSSYEGYGMTLVEAASAECPIITSKVGIANDLFEDGKNAFLCSVGDHKCFANKLVTLFENPSISKNLVKNMSETIESLVKTKEESLREYKQIIEEILPKK